MPLREALTQVQPYRPQRPMRELQAELGLERIVKLASNEGAFGPLPSAVAAFEASVGELNRYPDGGGLKLREALAERHGVPVEQVVLGNGADELIRLCAVATLDGGDRAAFPWPSFASYVAAAACSGAEGDRVPLRDRALDLDALLESARQPRTKLVYVANPNNPTGTLLDRAELRRFLGELPGGVLCVLDEAYAEYADEEPEGPALIREGAQPLCVLRTFSKVYGLAALRIGYALASPDVADALDRVRPVFNVNQPAQEAALASMNEREAVGLRVQHARARAGAAVRHARGGRARPDPVADELRVRRRAGRRRRGGRAGAAGARGHHRACADRVRCSRGDPGHGRHRRGERAVRRGDQARRAGGGREVKRLGLVLALLVALLLGACGGDDNGGGGSSDEGTTAKGSAYEVKLPDGWRDRTDEATDEDTPIRFDRVFATGPSGGFRTNVNVIRERLPENATLEQIVQVSRKQVRAAYQPTNMERARATKLGDEEAQSYAYALDAEGKKLRGEQVIALHGERIFYVTFTALEDAYRERHSEFQQILDSWTWD